MLVDTHSLTHSLTHSFTHSLSPHARVSHICVTHAQKCVCVYALLLRPARARVPLRAHAGLRVDTSACGFCAETHEHLRVQTHIWVHVGKTCARMRLPLGCVCLGVQLIDFIQGAADPGFRLCGCETHRKPSWERPCVCMDLLQIHLVTCGAGVICWLGLIRTQSMAHG